MSPDQTIATDTGAPTRSLGRREQTLEVLVFLFLILPSIGLSFFIIKQGHINFGLTVAATVLRDLGLVILILFFLWRNGERLSVIGWNFRKRWLDVVLGVVLFPAMFFGAGILDNVLKMMGFTAPATPLPILKPSLNVFHLILGVIFVAIVAVAEETIFRGYLILRFRNTTRSWGWAVFLSALVFSFGHGYEGSAGVITVGAMGVFFALTYIWRRSLVLPITLHFLQDFLSIILVPLFMHKP
jgi:membrane protease YdiL (CAAX protease family)